MGDALVLDLRVRDLDCGHDLVTDVVVVISAHTR